MSTTMTTAAAAALFALVPAALTTTAHAELQAEWRTYDVDGVTHKGYLVYDDEFKGLLPGIIVFPEWWGLTAHPRNRAAALAREGYIAFVPDMYGVNDEGEPKTTDVASEASALAEPLYNDRASMRLAAQAGLDILRRHPRTIDNDLAAIGFCFGGTVALELARSGAEIDLVATFHSGLSTPDTADDANIRATVLINHGARDPFVPTEEVTTCLNSFESHGIDYTFIAYSGAVHSFTNPAADDYGIEGAKYDEAADRRSWFALMASLQEAFAD